MKIDVNKIKRNLNTNVLARNIVYIEQVDSTQDEAKRYINNWDNGTYIVTDKQFKGRGTHGRSWYDNGYENICGSFILKPECDISRISNLTKVIAECIVKALSNLYGIKADIKDPNDIMINSRKLSGILTESTTSNGIVKSIIVGIGLNVNQVEFEPEIEKIATSLRKEYNKEFEREKIIAEFFNIFEKKYYKIIG